MTSGTLQGQFLGTFLSGDPWAGGLLQENAEHCERSAAGLPGFANNAFFLNTGLGSEDNTDLATAQPGKLTGPDADTLADGAAGTTCFRMEASAPPKGGSLSRGFLQEAKMGARNLPKRPQTRASCQGRGPRAGPQGSAETSRQVDRARPRLGEGRSPSTNTGEKAIGLRQQADH